MSKTETPELVRKYWRDYKRKYRLKKKAMDSTVPAKKSTALDKTPVAEVMPVDS